MKQLMKTFAGPDPTLTDIRRLASLDIAAGLNQVFRSLSPHVTLTQIAFDDDGWQSLDRVSKYYFRLAWMIAKKFAKKHSYQVKLDPEDLWSGAFVVLAEKLPKLASKSKTVGQFTGSMAKAIYRHYVDDLRRESGVRKRDGELSGNKVWTGVDDSVFENSTRGKSRPPTGTEMEEFLDTIHDLRAWIPALSPEDLEVITPLLNKLDVRADHDYRARELTIRFKSIDACRGQRNGTAKARAAELGEIFENRWNPNYEPEFIELAESDDDASDNEGRTPPRPGLPNVGADSRGDRRRNPCFEAPQSEGCTRLAAGGNRESRSVKFAQRDAEWASGNRAYSPHRCGGAKHE